jgi:hypothetical protein
MDCSASARCSTSSTTEEVAAVVSATVAMVSAIAPSSQGGLADPTVLSCVVEVCSSTALAMVVWNR